MQNKADRQAALYDLWHREIEAWIAPIVWGLRWTSEEKSDLLAELKHHTVRKLLSRQEDIKDLRAYCTQLAVNFIRDRFAAHAKHRVADTEHATESYPTDEKYQPERQAAYHEVDQARREIYELIKRIRFEIAKPAWDTAFSLTYDLGMSIRDTAQALDQPFATVQYRIASLVAAIRERLRELSEQDPDLRQTIAVAFGQERARNLLRRDSGS